MLSERSFRAAAKRVGDMGPVEVDILMDWGVVQWGALGTVAGLGGSLLAGVVLRRLWA